MDTFKGKVAAITGAASGIGHALALELARHGCHLALCDLNETGLGDTADEAAASGVRVTREALDVADRRAVHTWADRVAADHGRVNLVVNNAGVALMSTIEDLTYEDFEWIMGINFWGVVHGTKAFLPHLKATGDGHIVNLSSAFGLIAAPAQGAYNAAKFAVRGFTECLRQELDMMGCGVSCSSVHPGGTKTNIAQSARMSPALAANRERRLRAFDKTARSSADYAARVILDGVRQGKPRILVGLDAHLIDVAQRAWPAGYPRIVRRMAGGGGGDTSRRRRCDTSTRQRARRADVRRSPVPANQRTSPVRAGRASSWAPSSSPTVNDGSNHLHRERHRNGRRGSGR